MCHKCAASFLQKGGFNYIEWDFVLCVYAGARMENSALLNGQEMAVLTLNMLVEREEAGPKDVIDFLWCNECSSASNHLLQNRKKNHLYRSLVLPWTFPRFEK